MIKRLEDAFTEFLEATAAIAGLAVIGAALYGIVYIVSAGWHAGM